MTQLKDKNKSMSAIDPLFSFYSCSRFKQTNNLSYRSWSNDSELFVFFIEDLSNVWVDHRFLFTIVDQYRLYSDHRPKFTNAFSKRLWFSKTTTATATTDRCSSDRSIEFNTNSTVFIIFSFVIHRRTKNEIDKFHLFFISISMSTPHDLWSQIEPNSTKTNNETWTRNSTINESNSLYWPSKIWSNCCEHFESTSTISTNPWSTSLSDVNRFEHSLFSHEFAFQFSSNLWHNFIQEYVRWLHHEIYSCFTRSIATDVFFDKLLSLHFDESSISWRILYKIQKIQHKKFLDFDRIDSMSGPTASNELQRWSNSCSKQSREFFYRHRIHWKHFEISRSKIKIMFDPEIFFYLLIIKQLDRHK